MTPQDYYNDFLLIQQLKSPVTVKVRILSTLFASYANAWRVTGITQKALEVFASTNFKHVSKMGINRSHLTDRHLTYTHMLDTNWTSWEEWWKYYQERDATVFATSSENLSKNLSQIFPIDNTLGLFKARGFGWTNNKAEQTLLKQIYETINGV